MPKYFAKTQKFNDQKIHTVYEVDGDLEVPVSEGRTSEEAKREAERLNRSSRTSVVGRNA